MIRVDNPFKKILFPIHIYQNKIKENNICKDEILSKIDKMYNDDKFKIPEGWLTDKLSTSFDHPEFNFELFHDTKTIDLYQKYVGSFFDKKVKFIIDEIWYNYYVSGEWQEIHSHLSSNYFQKCSTFSCIHFLSYNSEIHPPVVFVDPHEKVRSLSMEMDSNYYENRHSPKITEGSIIMFPSYLEHFVPKGPPTPDYPRITIAFNLKVQQYGEYTAE
jgi:hypothetical protein